MGPSGLEPPTSRLSGVRSNRLSYEPSFSHCPLSLHSHTFSYGGGKRIRTDDPLLAKQVLSQLSYTPVSGSVSVLCPVAVSSTLKIEQCKPNSFAELEFLRYSSYLGSP